MTRWRSMHQRLLSVKLEMFDAMINKGGHHLVSFQLKLYKRKVKPLLIADLAETSTGMNEIMTER